MIATQLTEIGVHWCVTCLSRYEIMDGTNPYHNEETTYELKVVEYILYLYAPGCHSWVAHPFTDILVGGAIFIDGGIHFES